MSDIRSQGAIKGKGKTVETKPPLKDVFLVKGLKSNLISISQLCDEGLIVHFTKRECKAMDEENRVTLHRVRFANNCYVWQCAQQCFVAHDETSLWHQRLGHMNMRHMTNIIRKGAVRGIPQLEETEKTVCGPCNQGKQVKVQHKMIQDIQSNDMLEMVHMDLMGPMQTESIAGKRYVLVLVDDYSRFTWVRFIREKSDTLESFKIWVLQVTNGKRRLKQIRSDHGGEFQNEAMSNFCGQHGIVQKFVAPRTPQQNGVV